MKRLFLFNASANSRLYGIGNYVDIVYQTLKNSTGLKIIFIDFFQTKSQEYIEIKSDGQAEKFNCYFNGHSLFNLPHIELFSYLQAEYKLESTDIFHFNTPNHASLVQLLCEKINPKIIYTAHFNTLKLIENRAQTLTNERLLIQLAKHIICLSEETKNYIEEVVDAQKINMLHTPMVRSFRNWSSKKKSALKRSLRLTDENTILLFNGRIESQKGFNDILAVFPKLLLKYPNLILIVIGEGNFSEIIKKCRPFIGHIIFIGYIERKHKNFLQGIYQIADIFLLPSYNEQLSLSFLEAASQALASVVSDIPAFAKFPKMTVRKVPLRSNNRIDRNLLFQQIVELNISKEQREKLGSNLYQYCKKELSQRKFSTSLLKLYYA